MAQLDTELADIDAEMPTTDDAHTPLILRQIRGDAQALRIGDLQERRWKAQQRLEQHLTNTYLAAVNPIVRENFTDAMTCPEPAGTAESFHNHFRYHAAALTRAADIVAELTRQPVRTVPIRT